VQLDIRLLPRTRVRMVRQTELAECGLACIAMVLNYHGRETDLAALRQKFQPSLRGVSLRSLVLIADQLGLAARAVKLELDQLENIPVPAILHWDFNHYVVLERVAGSRALIHNPEGISRWIPFDQVSNHFTGIALELYPTEELNAPPQKDRLRVSQLWSRVRGLKRALAQTIALSIVLEAYVLALPYYLQVAVDNAIPALDGDLITTLAIGFGLFTMINAGATLLRSFVLLSAGTSLAYGISLNIARKLFQLPMTWFEKRHVGDILSRFQSIEPIRVFLTEGAVAALLDGVLAIVTLTVMFFYSPALSAIALVALSAHLLTRAALFRAQREAQEEVMIRSGKEQTVMIESLRGMLTVRLFNRETARRNRWQARLTEAANAHVKLSRVTLWQNLFNVAVLGLEYIVSVWLACKMVLAGGFSLGMLFAFISYKTIFLQRGNSLIDQFTAARILNLHLERLSDIALSSPDISFSGPPGAAKQLQGGIELRNISFRYSATDPLVLDDVSVTIPAGAHVALTGPSGEGKSTLAKIILGLVEPDHGEVLVDGVPLHRFGHRNYRDQLAAVLQEDSLFSGSLRDNITLFDEDSDMERVARAASAAAIHDDILAMPMRYDTLVGDMGSALSGGQRQRLLLARALYKEPRILLIDEGTSHLDLRLEAAVNAAVSELGITRIVIAHRRDTILAADTIYRLAGGKLAPSETGAFAP
jgi:ATP-binding cassette subfamily B protein RaxB